MATIVLASAVMLHGSTGEGREAARQVNLIHRKYDIHPDDFIMVGTEEVVGLIELAEHYSWRPITQKQQGALNLNYSRQSRSFGSPSPLRPTYDQTRAFFYRYLETKVRYEPHNVQLAKVLVKWIGELAPVPMCPFISADDARANRSTCCARLRPPTNIAADDLAHT